uniref:Uncharacterized protein n=1 Tax=Felis catus TaxID=9685 RepID=A0ABI7XLJ2_FELCA
MAQERGSEAPAPPGSQTLLDALLRNLYDFGETEDEAEEKRIRKKRENKRRDVGTPVTLAADPAPVPGSPMRGRRKRVSSFFKELREELQGVPAVTPTSSPSGPDAPSATASPSTLRNSRERVQVIEFHSRNKKRKGKPDQDENTQTKTNILGNDVDRQEFNLEKARLEVHRFGITGYGKGKERVLERERAIMLGAQVGGCFRLPASDRIQKWGKSPGQVRAWVTGRSLQNKKWYLFFFFLSFQPPKNSYVNYKVLQEQIKEKKAAKEEEKRMAQDTDIFKKKKRKGQEDRRAKKKKSAPSILSSGRIGQVGKFKNGTLILSQVDIKKINSSRVAK